MSDSELRELFSREVPHVDEGYVLENCPHLLKDAQRYNLARRTAASLDDVVACMSLRNALEVAART